MKNKIFLLPLILTTFLICPLSAQDETTAEYDWYRPGTINPMDPVIGDFLDIDLEDLLIKAENFYAAENYIDAARLYLVYLHYNIDDFTAIYNLACCYGLMAEPELAAGYLQRAVRAGFRNLDLLKADTDFDQVRDSFQFAAIYDSLGLAIARQKNEEGEIKYLKIGPETAIRIVMPEWFNPGKAYPLVVGLHGAGGSADEFMRSFSILEDDAPKCIFATLPGPYASAGNIPGYLWYRQDLKDSAAIADSYNHSVTYIADVIRELRKEFMISKVILVGFSMGSRIGFTTAIRNYDIINDFISFGGSLDREYLSDSELQYGQRIKVFIVHGLKDNAIRYQEAQSTRELLDKWGYNVAFYTFEGGHLVPDNILKETLEQCLK